MKNVRSIAKSTKSPLQKRWRKTLSATMGVAFSLSMFIVFLTLFEGQGDQPNEFSLQRTEQIRSINGDQITAIHSACPSDVPGTVFGLGKSVNGNSGRQDWFNEGIMSQTLHNNIVNTAYRDKSSAPDFASRWLLKYHKAHK